MCMMQGGWLQYRSQVDGGKDSGWENRRPSRRVCGGTEMKRWDVAKLQGDSLDEGEGHS